MFTLLQLRLICFRCLAFLSRCASGFQTFPCLVKLVVVVLTAHLPSLELFLPLPSFEKFAK